MNKQDRDELRRYSETCQTEMRTVEMKPTRVLRLLDVLDEAEHKSMLAGLADHDGKVRVF